VWVCVCVYDDTYTAHAICMNEDAYVFVRPHLVCMCLCCICVCVWWRARTCVFAVFQVSFVDSIVYICVCLVCMLVFACGCECFCVCVYGGCVCVCVACQLNMR